MDEPDEHTAAGLLAKLHGLSATPAQLGCVQAVLDYFESEGLLRSGRALPLYDPAVCPAAEACWSAVGASDRRTPELSEASVPWVGSNFERDRIAVVAINFNDYGALGANWWITRGHIRDLREGRRTRFGYRVAEYVAAVLASRAGRRAEVIGDPTTVAATFESIAFLQAVQCAPTSQAGKPSAAMWRECPGRYLAKQIELLAPEVVITLGREPGSAVRNLLRVTTDEAIPGLNRGFGSVGGESVEVIGVYHPARPQNWRRAMTALLESLEARPVTLASPSGE